MILFQRKPIRKDGKLNGKGVITTSAILINAILMQGFQANGRLKTRRIA